MLNDGEEDSLAKICWRRKEEATPADKSADKSTKGLFFARSNDDDDEKAEEEKKAEEENGEELFGRILEVEAAAVPFEKGDDEMEQPEPRQRRLELRPVNGEIKTDKTYPNPTVAFYLTYCFSNSVFTCTYLRCSHKNHHGMMK